MGNGTNRYKTQRTRSRWGAAPDWHSGEPRRQSDVAIRPVSASSSRMGHRPKPAVGGRINASSGSSYVAGLRGCACAGLSRLRTSTMTTTSWKRGGCEGWSVIHARSTGKSALVAQDSSPAEPAVAYFAGLTVYSPNCDARHSRNDRGGEATRAITVDGPRARPATDDPLGGQVRVLSNLPRVRLLVATRRPRSDPACDPAAAGLPGRCASIPCRSADLVMSF
jgi:hypothetical protein